MGLEPKVIRFTKDEEGFSVLLKDDGLKFEAWINIYIEEGDIISEWNQYNFNNDEKHIQNLQDNNEITDYFTSAAIRHLDYKGQIYRAPNGWNYEGDN